MKNNDFFADSILHVVASEQVDISKDLASESTKTISELLDEEKENQEKQTAT